MTYECRAFHKVTSFCVGHGLKKRSPLLVLSLKFTISRPHSRCGNKVMQSQDLRLDHFKIYDVNNIDVDAQVRLQGQFDDEMEPATIRSLIHYCNPVRKNNEPFYDSDAHLAWYSIRPIPEPMRIVVVNNQFGKDKLILGRPIALLAPSRKQGHEFSQQLDHYKVYRVLDGEPINRDVSLTDQFGGDKTTVRYPFAFGVPVRKRHAGQEFPINNERAHLTIYRIKPSSIEVVRRSRDQFGRHLLCFMQSTALAVPSLKESWQEFKS